MSKEQPSIDHFFKPVGIHIPRTKTANVSKDHPLIPTGPISHLCCSRRETESSQNRVEKQSEKQKAY